MRIDMQHEAVDAFAIDTVAQRLESERMLVPFHQPLRERLRRRDPLAIETRAADGILDVRRLIVAGRAEPELTHRPVDLGEMLQAIRREGRVRRLGAEETPMLVRERRQSLEEPFLHQVVNRATNIQQHALGNVRARDRDTRQSRNVREQVVTA